MEKTHIILTIVAIVLELRNIAMTRHLRHVERKVGVQHARPAEMRREAEIRRKTVV